MATKPIMITFANQKGGVGKSALCALFSTYLQAEGGMNVLVLDGDKQASIFNRRDSEKKNGVIDKDAFFIRQIDLSTEAFMIETVNAAFREMVNKKIDVQVVAVDTPAGAFEKDSVKKLFTITDFIVVPFKHQEAVMDSTFQFLREYGNLDCALNGQLLAQRRLIFVPNCINPKWGTAKEREVWKKTLDTFESKFGKVTKPVYEYKCLSNWDTINLFPEQKSHVEQTFYDIFDEIAQKVGFPESDALKAPEVLLPVNEE